MSEHSTAAVIGGGIAGTTAAYELQKQGFRVTLFENRDRVGGRIWTIRKGDFLMDLGTAVYLGTYREAVALIKEVGLTDEFVERPAMGAMTRDGVNHHFDYTKPIRTGLTTKYLPMKSKIKALKLAKDVYKHRKSLGYDTYDALGEIDTETVREYCRRELNEELLQWVGRPLVSGTWVADDEETSVALMHWTVRNMLVDRVYNLTSGVVGLPQKLSTYYDVKFGHEVSNVTDSGTQAEVTYTANGVQQTESFDTCVIATTAKPALSIYPQMDENTRGLYETTTYRRLGSICLGLTERPEDPATYFLVPPAEDPDTIAVIADHHKAPGRAPEGKGLLTVLLSHEYLNRTDHLPDDDVLDYAIDRASKYHGRDIGSLVEEHMLVRWPESVPTLDRGRFARIADYRRRTDHTARVQFASDLDRIPGLNGGLVSGKEAAARVTANFASRTTSAVA